MTNHRALASQERELQAKRLSRIGRAVLLSAATVLTFLTAALLVADHMYRPDTFAINQLKLKGKFQYITPSDVQAVVFEEKLGNFFSVELDAIKQRVEKLAWVQHADVRREWPSSVVVSVREHRPIMKWNTLPKSDEANKAGDQWVSAAGQIIALDKPLNKPSPMLLNGTEYDAKALLVRALSWQKKLALSGLDVTEVTLSPSQAWTLDLRYTLDDEEGSQAQFELMLGREKIDARLERFQVLFDTKFKYANQRLMRVDARYPDGLAVQAEEFKVSQSDNASTINPATDSALANSVSSAVSVESLFLLTNQG